MASFNYEWWTVSIKDQSGTNTWEFKGKSKEHIVRRIEKEIADTNSEKNLAKDCWHRKPAIIEVYWDTLKLDRIGYQRLS